jgi:hypothetical protein
LPTAGNGRGGLVTVTARTAIAVAAPSAATTATATATAAITATAATAAETTTTTAAAATAAEAAATTAAAEAALTRGALLARTRDVHGERTPAEVLAVEHFNGTLGFLGRRELDEGESAGTTGELVEHQVHVEDDTGARKVILNVTLHRLVGEIAHKQTVLIFHNNYDRFKHRVGICPRQNSD